MRNADERRSGGALWALLAAGLYALNVPFSKLLLSSMPATMLAALLYLGAGAGLLLAGVVRARLGRSKAACERPLERSDLPYLAAMVTLDIAAPVLLLLGLSTTSAANASLLNNFEIVATSVIALCVFREPVSKRLWFAIALVTLSSAVLSVENAASFVFSRGSAFVLLACVCWGFENNCTRRLSAKDPLQIVVVKGWGSGLGALAIALARGERLPGAGVALPALLLGFVAYGLSIYCYIRAQRALGAAKTSAYYAVSPFIGAALSFPLLREPLSPSFLIALPIMLAGAYLASTRARRERVVATLGER